jgi:hypothetical protein
VTHVFVRAIFHSTCSHRATLKGEAVHAAMDFHRANDTPDHSSWWWSVGEWCEGRTWGEVDVDVVGSDAVREKGLLNVRGAMAAAADATTGRNDCRTNSG